jgi:hypothetical protein
MGPVELLLALLLAVVFAALAVLLPRVYRTLHR